MTICLLHFFTYICFCKNIANYEIKGTYIKNYNWTMEKFKVNFNNYQVYTINNRIIFILILLNKLDASKF